MSMESWLERQAREEEIMNMQIRNIVRVAVDSFEETQVKSERNTQCAEEEEYTGGSVSYYKVKIGSPLSGSDAYTAECNDIIEALGMNYAEGNAFKAIWRMCAARTLGKKKYGYKNGLYDAEKVEFFAGRMVEQQKRDGK